ncbi:MAG: 23S rRNA (pseudouridine(1915)-N(3))-methyltransferase RlmH [Pseudomonadales bacterium]
MKIRLIAVGGRPPEWVSTGFQDYARRLPREMSLELIEVPSAARKNLSARRAREFEAERLLAQVGARDLLVALDERGRTWSTVELSERLDDWRMQGRDVAFLIGGADGLDDACRVRADQVLALSAMTLPHALVRVVLAEQIYRAWTILSGHPYHRGD